MKVVEQPEIYQKEHQCRDCKATLLIEESDVKLGNFAVFYAGEKEDYKAYFVCVCCGTKNVLEDFPVWKLRNV